MTMKLSKHQQLQLLSFPSNSNPTISLLFHPSNASLSSLSSTELTSPKPKLTTSNLKLTKEELNKINLLIPRLCLSNHITTAINLTTTALLTNPPPKSLSLSILIHSLTSQPDLTLPMSLLTRLKHTPQAHHQHLTPITTMLITSFLKKGRSKEALKVYHWMIRPGSPCLVVEPMVYSVLVNGFCVNGFVLEALKVLRDMVGIHLVPEGGLRKRVFRSLLREARVVEAKELDEALKCVGDNGDDEGVKKVFGLLDHMIGNWTE